MQRHLEKVQPLVLKSEEKRIQLAQEVNQFVQDIQKKEYECTSCGVRGYERF